MQVRPGLNFIHSHMLLVMLVAPCVSVVQCRYWASAVISYGAVTTVAIIVMIINCTN